MRDNQHLWDQFIRLGERIGDGDLDASESKWMNREYKKLSRHLIPELKEQDKEERKRKADRINSQMPEFLEKRKCECGGKLVQARKGTLSIACTVCPKRYKASLKKAK